MIIYVKYLNHFLIGFLAGLDNLENELTPDAEDNCIQKSSVRWSKIREIPWEDTATARIYRKNNLEMTNRLRKIGKLHDETSI